jgi:hypothetical protein
MALRLACKRFMTQQHLLSSRAAAGLHRSFAAPASSPTPVEGAAASPPTVFDKLISLTIVDPSGARRKINGMVGECVKNSHPASIFFVLILLLTSSCFVLSFLVVVVVVVFRRTRHDPLRGVRNERGRTGPLQHDRAVPGGPFGEVDGTRLRGGSHVGIRPCRSERARRPHRNPHDSFR